MGKIGQRISGTVTQAVVEQRARYVEVRLDGSHAFQVDGGPSPLVVTGTRELPGSVRLYVPDDAEMPAPGSTIVLVGGIGIDGCLTKAQTNEPIFVLLGRDATAADVVRDWVQRVLEPHRANHDRQYLRADVEDPQTPLSDALRAKLVEALDQADAMEAWPGRRNPS